MKRHKVYKLSEKDFSELFARTRPQGIMIAPGEYYLNLKEKKLVLEARTYEAMLTCSNIAIEELTARIHDGRFKSIYKKVV